MAALGMLLLVPVCMWGGQTILLRHAGIPIRLRIGAEDLPLRLRRLNRVITQSAFAAVLLGYPLLRGQSPVAYYARYLPLAGRPLELAYGAAAAILYLALLYLAWAISDNVQFRVRHDGARLLRRLAGAPLTAVFAASVEEFLFRAVLLAGLLETFDRFTALTLGALIFAAAHYIRRVKRYWTFPGHLALGFLLCSAFLLTGALWLPLGLHAGGVLVLAGVRPLVRYRGPAWLVGASIYPYAGAVGIAALLLLTMNIWLAYGAQP
jgi:membrane protease YdiL (CAAX protease family)